MVKIPLKYQILEKLIKVYEKIGKTSINNVESIVGEEFPDVTGADLRSILSDLKNEKLVNYLQVDNDVIDSFCVATRARSVLIEVREELQRKEEERREARSWQLKSMAIGYVFGVLSGLLLTWLKELIFG